MAARSSKLIIRLTARAETDLEEIWHWNYLTHGAKWADEYRAFLKAQMASLLEEHGRPVPGEPSLEYVTIKKRPRRHGHVAVFRREGNEVAVLHFFHAAQNWFNHVGEAK